MKKVFVSIYFLKIDKCYDVELPINISMNVVVSSIQNTIVEISNGAYVFNNNVKLYDSESGNLINLNNIVKFSGIKNGDMLLLV